MTIPFTLHMTTMRRILRVARITCQKKPIPKFRFFGHSPSRIWRHDFHGSHCTWIPVCWRIHYDLILLYELLASILCGLQLMTSRINL